MIIVILDIPTFCSQKVNFIKGHRKYWINRSFFIQIILFLHNPSGRRAMTNDDDQREESLGGVETPRFGVRLGKNM